MAVVQVNGIRLRYAEFGSGDPVLLVMGTGAKGDVWTLHQVPALVTAGYRAIIVDNRGIAPSEGGDGDFTIDDLVADVAGLIQRLEIGPCRLVGVSMGALVVQELILRHPELAAQAVLLATRGRTDPLRAAITEAELRFHDSGGQLPGSYQSVLRALQNLSPHTLNDETKVTEWLALLDGRRVETPRAQLALSAMADRREAYREIRVPTLVVAFSDDLLTPPHLGREVADSIPSSQFTIIPECGHYGYLERPGAVNETIISFFQRSAGPS